MKILLVNMSIDRVKGGGTVERTLKLFEHLKNHSGVDVKLLTTDVGIDNHEQSAEIIMLPSISQRWYLPWPKLPSIYKAIKWSDVIILINHWTALNAIVHLVNKLISRPYLFCPAGALAIFGRSRLLKRLYNYFIGNNIVAQASRLIAIPNSEKEELVNSGIDPSRVVVIPNGVSESDFSSNDTDEFRQKYALSDAPFILFMGRLNEIKGPDILMYAFSDITKHYPDWHLVFAGPDGGMEENLRSIAAEVELQDRTHFIGYIQGLEKSSAYSAASLLAIPSRQEAMSIVALEAGICGTPVIMTDVCGFPEMAEADAAIETRLDQTEFTNELGRLIKDPDRLELMGRNAKTFIAGHYSWERAAEEHLILCEELISSK